MTDISGELEVRPSPLTNLRQEEDLFQTSVRRFARERIAPVVREMDERGIFGRELVDEFFGMGWMGIARYRNPSVAQGAAF